MKRARKTFQYDEIENYKKGYFVYHTGLHMSKKGKSLNEHTECKCVFNNIKFPSHSQSVVAEQLFRNGIIRQVAKIISHLLMLF